jgi:hypothetical protein
VTALAFAFRRGGKFSSNELDAERARKLMRFSPFERMARPEFFEKKTINRSGDACAAPLLNGFFA